MTDSVSELRELDRKAMQPPWARAVDQEAPTWAVRLSELSDEELLLNTNFIAVMRDALLKLLTVAEAARALVRHWENPDMKRREEWKCDVAAASEALQVAVGALTEEVANGWVD